MVVSSDYFRALIIKHIVDKDEFSKDNLSGINSMLDSLTMDTLKSICEDYDISYEED